MLSMVEVRCPHCGIHGQIMLPPLGAIIVGPCPNCNELVLVFSGKVLPLSKEILTEGDVNQKAAHLRTVIMDYLAHKINQVAEQLDDQVLDGLHDYTPEVDDYQPPAPPTPKPEAPQPKIRGSGVITDSEVKFFLKHEIPHIDEPDYFRRNLGS